MLCSSCGWYLGRVDNICVRAPIQGKGFVSKAPLIIKGNCPHYRRRKGQGCCISCFYYSGRIDSKCRAPNNPRYVFKVSLRGGGCSYYLKRGSLIGPIKQFTRNHKKLLIALMVYFFRTNCSFSILFVPRIDSHLENGLRDSIVFLKMN